MADDTTTRACTADHERMLEQLRSLPTPALGALLRLPMERALADPQDAAARASLRLGGEVLSERKGRKAA